VPADTRKENNVIDPVQDVGKKQFPLPMTRVLCFIIKKGIETRLFKVMDIGARFEGGLLKAVSDENIAARPLLNPFVLVD
jgi:hypothetical protein